MLHLFWLRTLSGVVQSEIVGPLCLPFRASGAATPSLASGSDSGGGRATCSLPPPSTRRPRSPCSQVWYAYTGCARIGL